MKENIIRDPHTKIIRFVKNFGQTFAIQAGIDYSEGYILVTIDTDLQNDPADIPKLLDKLEEGYDMVNGWRRNRKDSLFTKLVPSYIANKLISLLTEIKLHDFGCTLKAYKRKTVETIRLYGEMHRIIPMYVAMQGYRIAEVEVSHQKRQYGRSKYGLTRVLKLTLDFIVARFFANYATKPIYIFGGTGIILNLLGVMFGVMVVVRKIFLAGVWISPLLFISFMFFVMGIQSFLMGILAEMIMRINFRHEKVLFPYVVREIVKFGG